MAATVTAVLLSFKTSVQRQKSNVESEFKKKTFFSQYGEGTVITNNKYVHETAIAEMLRVVHFFQ